jgi:spermidine dehydrogenase
VGLFANINMGDYKAPRTPDEPIVVTCGGGIDFKYKAGMTARDMFRATRAALYETAFETFERRTSCARARRRRLRSGERHQRHHHKPVGTRLRHGSEPAVRSRLVGRGISVGGGPQRFGRIAIANSDAEGVCLTQAAFDQAHRAVDELMKRQVAWWNRV